MFTFSCNDRYNVLFYHINDKLNCKILLLYYNNIMLPKKREYVVFYNLNT